MRKVIILACKVADGVKLTVLNASHDEIMLFHDLFVVQGTSIKLESEINSEDVLYVTEFNAAIIFDNAIKAMRSGPVEVSISLMLNEGNGEWMEFTTDQAKEGLVSKSSDLNLEKVAASMLDVVAKLMESLGRSKDSCIIAGSLALFIQDVKFDLSSMFHDVDLIMPVDSDLLGKLKVLAANSAEELATDSVKLYPENSMGNARIDFIFKGVKFNVWLSPEYNTRKFMYMDYFKFASVRSILAYKAKYSRMKDWDYFMKAFESFYKDVTV